MSTPRNVDSSSPLWADQRSDDAPASTAAPAGDRAAAGRARLAERARRVRRIRRSVVAGTVAAFALAWGVIVFDGSMGSATTVATSTGTTTSGYDDVRHYVLG